MNIIEIVGLIVGIWSVIGGLFFIIWHGINEASLFMDKMPLWKTVAATIIGGPAVWLMALLSK